MFEKTQDAMAARQPRQRRRHHPLAWIAAGVNVGFFAWLLAGVGAFGPYTSGGPTDAQATGWALAAVGIGFLWLVADLVLLVVWAARRSRQPRRR